jgi:putative tryptophan/tyrosine transport system substrate-binding protein
MRRVHSIVDWFCDVLPRRSWLWLVVAVVIVCQPQRSLASNVVLVLSSEAAPFQQAGQAAGDRLRQEGYAITSRVLQSDREHDRVWLMGNSADAYLAIGSEAARLLRQTLPSGSNVSYCMVTDPEALGLVEHGAVGVSTDVPIELQYELIAEALPHARTVGMLYHSDHGRSSRLRERAEQSLPDGWRLEAVAINDHPSTAEAIDALFSRRIDIVWTAPDSSVYDSATVRALLLGSVRRRVPVFGFSSPFVRAGALVGVSITPQRQGRRAGELTAEMLMRQSSDSDRGRIVPPQFDVSVNLIVAEAIKVDLPRSLIDRAQTVIRQE